MTYSIGDVEELTGIKAHILRYWENVISGFSPKKDLGGRRIYSQRELELIFRLKYLIYEKKFTVEGAGNQILNEASSVQNNAEILQQIHQCRQELSEVYLLVKKYKK